MPTVYCASKARYARWWQALRAAGVPIVASWIDWAPNHDGREPTAEQWRHHWFDCIEQAAGADIALFVNSADETACGL